MIRDSNGQVIVALSRKFNAPLGALEVEAKAFEMGLEFARDVCVQDFILEGDSLVVYNALYGFSTPPSMIASIVRGILMSCGPLDRINSSHVKMQGNRLAHLLAKHALGIVDYLTWMEETPCFLEQALLHNVSFI